MKLCTKMAHICIRAINQAPELKRMARDYFRNSCYGRFGYHASQLVNKHGLVKPVASRMSAILNLWLDQLDKLGNSICKPTLDRLRRCTRSYSDLTNLVSTCDSKLCPLCRAIRIMDLESRVDRLKPQAYTQEDFKLGTMKRADPESVLVVKNVVLKDGGLVLRVLQFYRGLTTTRKPVTSMLIRDLLQYDYRILFNPVAMSNWVSATRNMSFFSKRYKPRVTKKSDSQVSV